MQLFEIQGLLAGKCLPGDIKGNESLAEYLLRQLDLRDELARQVSALQLSQDNIINAFGISGEGAHSKLVIEYVLGLVAENAALKSVESPCGAIENGRAFIDRLESYPFESQGGDLKTCSDWQSLVQCFDYLAEFAHVTDNQTPNTDAAIAEIKASELDDLASSIMEYAPVIEADEYYVYEVIAKDVTDRAAGLRAGRKG